MDKSIAYTQSVLTAVPVLVCVNIHGGESGEW